MAQFPAVIGVSSLDGTNGFRTGGVAVNSFIGRTSASADVNGDGFNDLIFHGRDAPGQPFLSSYVIFGKASGYAANIDLSTLNGSNGFKLRSVVTRLGDVNGDGFDDWVFRNPDVPGSVVVFGTASRISDSDAFNRDGTNGFRVTGPGVTAGDVNGDGFDDVIISGSGRGHVVFGKASGFAADIDVSSLDGSNGFTLGGGDASVSSVGDVNGDGFDDLTVFIPGYDGEYAYFPDTRYLVYGKASGFAANVDLSSLDASDGFKMSGSLRQRGDVNGDGFDDWIVYNPGIRGPVVVFGTASGVSESDALNRDGTNGFRVTGSGGASGVTGDVNGDGFDDVIFTGFGVAHVVFGKASGFAATIDMSSLDGSNGFKLDPVVPGEPTNLLTYHSVGDMNDDGFDDIVLDVAGASPNAYRSGAIYVVFGRAPDTAVDRTGTVASQTLAGGAFNDVLAGLGGDDSLYGNGGNDTLKGGTGNDRLKGGAGNDELNGGTGADRLEGGDGNDTYIVDNALDVVVETGTGYDRISTSVSVALTASQAIDFLNGRGTADLALAGNQLANSVWGSVGNDTISGAGGADILRGKGGNDTLFGGKGNDILEGGDGADRFRYRLGDGNDRFTDFSGAGGDRVALTNVTVSQLVNNIATLSDGSVLTAQTGYMWAASDFMPA